MPKNKTPNRRIAGLDGIRGIAVIAVLLFHFWPDFFPGGFLGVDMFFVLSGFLITSLLTSEFLRTNKISLKKFWQKRARRIIPAALSVILIGSAATLFMRDSDISVDLGVHALTSAFFVANWAQIADSHSYFADTQQNIFTHYWSLAIEEQFYLLWPLLFIILAAVFTFIGGGGLALLRRKPISWRSKAFALRLLAICTLFLGALSFALMLLFYNPQNDPTRVYFGTDTHSFGLAIGAALGILLTLQAENPKIKTHFDVAGWWHWIALAAMAALVAVLHGTAEITFRGGLLAASLVTALLIFISFQAHTSGQTTAVSRLLASKALKWFGDRSFSIYLWHWPILLFVIEIFARNTNSGNRTEFDSLTEFLWVPLITLACTIFIAAFSYAFIETPFRTRGYRGTLKHIFASVGTSFRSIFKTANPARLIAATLAALALFTTAVFAGVTAPQETKLELALAQQKAQQEKLKQQQLAAQQKAEAARKAEEERKAAELADYQNLPAGTSITAVGDSVMLASLDALNEKFPGIYVDAEVSRHYYQAAEVIADLKAAGSLQENVVLGLGTNGRAPGNQLEQLIDSIGDRQIFLVVPSGPMQQIDDAAKQIFEVAQKYDNVHLALWCTQATTHPDLMYADRIHPTAEGGVLYAEAIAQAMLARADPNFVKPTSCS